MTDYSAGSASIDIGPNLDGFVSALRSRLEAIDAELTVDIDADVSRVERRLDELRGRTVDVGVDVDTRVAEARLDELTRDRTVRVNVDVDRSSIAGARGAADQATRSLSAMSAVRFGGLAAGITALIPALGGAAAAAGGVVSAIGAIGGVVGVGGYGVIGAFQAMGDASSAAGADAADAARQQVDGLDRVRDAQDRVADAQHDYEDALRSERDAQRGVIDARRDAKDAIDNLNLSVRDGALSERGAEISYRRAVERLQDVRARAAIGRASSTDVDEAALGVDEAAQNITDVKVRNAQTKSKADDANAKGVEGSDQVVAAKQQLDSAQYQVLQAAQSSSQAVRELARAQEDLATQSTSAGAGQDKLAEAMAKLSPNARQFVTAMQALGPQWTQLRMAVQDNLFAGLGDAVTTLATNQLPALQSVLGQLATGLNTALRDTLSGLDATFTRLTQSGQMQAFIDGINQAMTGIAPLVTGLTETFVNLGATIGPTLGPLFAGLGQSLAAMSGPLGELGATFTTTLTQMLPSLTTLVNALAQGLQPVLPVIGQLFDALSAALVPIIPSLSTIAATIGQALVTAIQAIAPSLPLVAQAFADLFTGLAPLVPPVAQLASIFIGAMAQGLSALFQALAPVITEFTNGLQPIIPVITKAVQDLTPVITEMAGEIGQALLQAVQDLMPHLPGLIESFTNLLIELAPLLPVLLRMGLEVLPPLTEAAKVMADPLSKIIDLFATLAKYVTKAVDAFSNLGGGLFGKLVKGGMASSVLGPIGNKLFGAGDSNQNDASLTGSVSTGGGSGVIGSMASVVGSQFPSMQVTSTTRDEPGSYHSTGQAVDFSDGTDDTPGMQALSNFIADNYQAETLELIHAPFGRNIKNGQDVGDGMSVYGASTMAQHRNHVHWAVAAPIGPPGPTVIEPAGVEAAGVDSERVAGGAYSPTGTYVGPGAATSGAYLATDPSATTSYAQAALPGRVSDEALQIEQSKAQVDQANSKRNQIYADPRSTDADRKAADFDYLQAQNSLESAQKSSDSSLPEEYSVQGIASRGAGILATGLLSFFGLENSVLSSSNPYNRGINKAIDFYADKNKSADPTGGYAYVPQNLAQPNTSGAGGAYRAAPATAGGYSPNSYAPGEYSPGEYQPNVTDIPGPQLGYNPDGGAEQWRPTVERVLQAKGLPASEADRVLMQMDSESSGNPRAINTYDINAQNGTPSKGLLQVIDPTFATYADPGFDSDIWDPESNIRASINYGIARYGSLESAYRGVGYDSGGEAFGKGLLMKQVIKPERVLSPTQTETFNSVLPLMEEINARGWSPGAPERGDAGSSGRGGNIDRSVNFFGDTNVMDTRELAETIERRSYMAAGGGLAALS